jgi:ComF family protein
MDALKVDGWLRKAVRAVFSPRCLLCGESGVDDRDLCRACAEALPWNRSACLRCALPLHAPGTCGACLQRPPPLAETHAVFVYGFPLDRLVPRFKFHNDLAAGRLLSELMLESVSGLPRPSALVPVPLHEARLRQRGYDQALELAKPLARALQVPLLSEALVRTRATAPQSELDAGARRRNLRRAFEIRAGAALPDHVALVDDVMTTGATLEAAAKTLRRAGVARVDAWVCARVP